MKKLLLVAHWDWVLWHFRMPIARALRDAGAEVVLVCPDGPEVEHIRSEGFQWLEWQVERRSLSPLREARSISRLVGIYYRERPVAVHHYTIKPSLYGTLAGRVARVPQIINVFSGLGFVFGDDRRARRLRSVLFPLLRIAFRSRRVRVFALNGDDLTRLRDLRLVRAERSGLLPEGTDTQRFHPAEPDRTSAQPPVVILGCRLLAEKGVRDFVDAARLLRGRGTAARFLIAGEPDRGNPSSIDADELAAWAREGMVELLGARDDMDEVLRSADIAVLPTHYKEGLPWFLLEAGATGLPLVATDVQGCRDVVIPGETGLLVPPRDPEALADAIGQLLLDPGRRRRLGNGARELVLERHSEQGVQQAHLDLYRSLGVLP